MFQLTLKFPFKFALRRLLPVGPISLLYLITRMNDINSKALIS